MDATKTRTPAVRRHDDIARKLREDILRGVYAPGNLLPTIRELATHFNTSIFTIQTAMQPLVEQGLLEPKRRVGTRVSHSLSVLSCAGIYLLHDVVGGLECAFHRELCNRLRLNLAQRGIQARTFVDMRQEADQSEALPELLSAVEEHRIQALFVPLSAPHVTPWLAALPLPSSFVTTISRSNRVDSDAEEMVRLALRALRQRGCVTVGMIGSNAVRRRVPLPEPYAEMLFREMAGDFGLSTRDEWIWRPEKESGFVSHEMYGYETFKTVWKAPERPDGLFVHTDITARGAMTAMLELGVDVPGDLKAVFLRNSGLEWACPLNVDWVESDTDRWAVEMIRMALLQRSGETPEPVLIPFNLISI